MAVKTVLENFAKELKNTFQAPKNIVDVSADYIEKLSEEDIGEVTQEEMEAVTGDLDDLTTTSKSNLVSAINEVNGKDADDIYLSDNVTTIEQAINKRTPNYGDTTTIDITETYNVTQDGFIMIRRFITTGSGTILTINSGVAMNMNNNIEGGGLLFPVKSGDTVEFGYLDSSVTRAFFVPLR